MRGLLDAIRDSDAVKSLESLRTGPRTVVVNNGRGPVTYTIDRTYIAYLQKGQELFARAYAQWVTEKSGDPILIRQLSEKLSNIHSDPVAYRHQWDHDDFKSIADEFNKLFRSLGWVL
jgi:hypothetical protein